MNNFSRAFFQKNRLVILSFSCLIFLLIFRFQIALSWIVSEEKMISGLNVVVKFSWTIAAYACLLYLMVGVIGFALSRRIARSSSLEIVEHRLFFAIFFISVSWMAIFLNSFVFESHSLTTANLTRVLISSLLISLMIKRRKKDL